MATTVTKPAARAAKGRPKKAAEPGTLDYLQSALEDLDRARGLAQKDVQSSIDAASERIRTAVDDVRGRLHKEADDLQVRLDRASEEVRVELGMAVIRAQRTPDALDELALEISRQKELLAA